MDKTEWIFPLKNNRLDLRMATAVSNCLLEAGIPCVLWGNWLMSIHGVNGGSNCVEFVVPDESIEAAAGKISTSSGLPRCSDPNCDMLPEDRGSRPPAAHFHLDEDRGTGLTLDLHLKSTTLGFIPSLVFQPQSEKEVPDIIEASDPSIPLFTSEGGPTGRLQGIPISIYIPSLHILTEAWIRDSVTAKNESHGDFADIMVAEILMYADKYEPVNTSLMEPRIATYFLGLRNRGKHLKSHRKMYSDLKSAFSADGEMIPEVPLPPRKDDSGNDAL
ncbi:hypothetical protein ONS95_011908 [Cadophora gregata]|uniref:uncharacterized protein n=1 Tax=Cadophora gregata TaxID=51156 RepID=UPI0026DC2DD8|nr:uncharacterized protein ONS95_011908 [Cadophora gregata]KAK0117572.1 hypothetical protein ONS95_011908 [Cadophora gregata]KAK0122623.1 hypothetical protein ONS96_009663 [Cadophora gregata f. sp. sojae]